MRLSRLTPITLLLLLCPLLAAASQQPVPPPTPDSADQQTSQRPADAGLQTPTGNEQTAAPVAKVPPEQGEARPSATPAQRGAGPAANVAGAAQESHPTPYTVPGLERFGVEMTDQRTLTLREAIELALKNSKEIEVARANVRLAEFDLLGSKAVYDPRLSFASSFGLAETPVFSALSGGVGSSVTQSDVTSSFRFEGAVPKGGGAYRLDFSSGRLTSDNLFVSLNPQYPSALTFTYTQPLLRGRRFDDSRARIEIARKNLSLTDAQFRQRAIETIITVQYAYWDLVFALRNLQVQSETLRDAREQLEHNKRLVADGVLAPIDVVAVKAQIARLEQGVYVALDDVNRTENTLKNLIAESRTSDMWEAALVPTDSADVKAPAASLLEAIAAALRSRPELQQSDVAREINELDQRLAREQLKPQVDMVGSYGVVGLAGSLNTGAVNPFTTQNARLVERVNELSARSNLLPLPSPLVQTVPGVLVGGLPQSLSNLAANRFNNYRVGVQMSFPLRNRAADAQLGRTLVEEGRIKTQREQLEQLIQVDVRNALQLMRTAESRLRAAIEERAASEQQYASERRRLEAGQSTVFLVLERQTALASARGDELRAQTELNKAIANVQRATGNALEANQVQVLAR